MPAHRTFARERTAALILEAIELGMAPARMLQEFYEIPYHRARYMVRAVRAEGLLGVPPHRPVRMISRRQGLSAVVVCEHCVQTWPCQDGFPWGGPPHKEDIEQEYAAHEHAD